MTEPTITMGSSTWPDDLSPWSGLPQDMGHNVFPGQPSQCHTNSTLRKSEISQCNEFHTPRPKLPPHSKSTPRHSKSTPCQSDSTPHHSDSTPRHSDSTPRHLEPSHRQMTGRTDSGCGQLVNLMVSSTVKKTRVCHPVTHNSTHSLPVDPHKPRNGLSDLDYDSDLRLDPGNCDLYPDHDLGADLHLHSDHDLHPVLQPPSEGVTSNKGGTKRKGKKGGRKVAEREHQPLSTLSCAFPDHTPRQSLVRTSEDHTPRHSLAEVSQTPTPKPSLAGLSEDRSHSLSLARVSEDMGYFHWLFVLHGSCANIICKSFGPWCCCVTPQHAKLGVSAPCLVPQACKEALEDCDKDKMGLNRLSQANPTRTVYPKHKNVMTATTRDTGNPSKDRSATRESANANKEKTSVATTANRPAKEKSFMAASTNTPAKEKTSMATTTSTPAKEKTSMATTANAPAKEKTSMATMANTPAKEKTSMATTTNTPAKEKTFMATTTDTPAKEKSFMATTTNSRAKEKILIATITKGGNCYAVKETATKSSEVFERFCGQARPYVFRHLVDTRGYMSEYRERYTVGLVCRKARHCPVLGLDVPDPYSCRKNKPCACIECSPMTQAKMVTNSRDGAVVNSGASGSGKDNSSGDKQTTRIIPNLAPVRERTSPRNKGRVTSAPDPPDSQSSPPPSVPSLTLSTLHVQHETRILPLTGDCPVKGPIGKQATVLTAYCNVEERGKRKGSEPTGSKSGSSRKKRKKKGTIKLRYNSRLPGHNAAEATQEAQMTSDRRWESSQKTSNDSGQVLQPLTISMPVYVKKTDPEGDGGSKKEPWLPGIVHKTVPDKQSETDVVCRRGGFLDITLAQKIYESKQILCRPKEQAHRQETQTVTRGKRSWSVDVVSEHREGKNKEQKGRSKQRGGFINVRVMSVDDLPFVLDSIKGKESIFPGWRVQRHTPLPRIKDSLLTLESVVDLPGEGLSQYQPESDDLHLQDHHQYVQYQTEANDVQDYSVDRASDVTIVQEDYSMDRDSDVTTGQKDDTMTDADSSDQYTDRKATSVNGILLSLNSACSHDDRTKQPNELTLRPNRGMITSIKLSNKTNNSRNLSNDSDTTATTITTITNRGRTTTTNTIQGNSSNSSNVPHMAVWGRTMAEPCLEAQCHSTTEQTSIPTTITTQYPPFRPPHPHIPIQPDPRTKQTHCLPVNFVKRQSTLQRAVPIHCRDSFQKNGELTGETIKELSNQDKLPLSTIDVAALLVKGGTLVQQEENGRTIVEEWEKGEEKRTAYRIGRQTGEGKETAKREGMENVRAKARKQE